MPEGNVNLASGDFQTLLNEQERRNRLNQRDPFGNRLTFTDDGQVRQRFGAPVQGLVDQLFASAGQPLSLMPFNPGDFETSRRAAEQASFDRAMSLLNPQFELQEERLQQRLANQGLPQASRANIAETGRFEDSRNRALQDAANAAVLQGLQAQQQGFGQALAGQQQNIGQQLAQFQLPFQQQMSLFGATQPQFVNVPGVDVNNPFAALLQADMAQKAQNFSFGRDLLPGLIGGGSRVGAAFAGA